MQISTNIQRPLNWKSPCMTLMAGKCLPLGPCKVTVKKSKPSCCESDWSFPYHHTSGDLSHEVNQPLVTFVLLSCVAYWAVSWNIDLWPTSMAQDNNELTHWGWVMHICVSKVTFIGSDNGLWPGRHQAIICTNARILLIQTLGTNFNEILSKIHIFGYKKMHLKMSSGKWRPFCLGLNMLTLYWLISLEETKIYLHFLSFLNTRIKQGV